MQEIEQYILPGVPLPPQEEVERITDAEIADTALNWTPPVTITKPERKLIADLLKLYETMTEHTHGYSCGCSLCEAHDACGGNDAATFESLEKVLNL